MLKLQIEDEDIQNTRNSLASKGNGDCPTETMRNFSTADQDLPWYTCKDDTLKLV